MWVWPIAATASIGPEEDHVLSRLQATNRDLLGVQLDTAQELEFLQWQDSTGPLQRFRGLANKDHRLPRIMAVTFRRSSGHFWRETFSMVIAQFLTMIVGQASAKKAISISDHNPGGVYWKAADLYQRRSHPFNATEVTTGKGPSLAWERRHRMVKKNKPSCCRIVARRFATSGIAFGFVVIIRGVGRSGWLPTF